MIYFFLRIIRSNYKIGSLIIIRCNRVRYTTLTRREKKTISANTQSEVVKIVFFLFCSTLYQCFILLINYANSKNTAVT